MFLCSKAIVSCPVQVTSGPPPPEHCDTRYNLALWAVEAVAGLLVLIVNILVQDKAVMNMIYVFMVSTLAPLLYLRGAQ